MQPFHCMVQRRFQCSPVRNSANQILNTSKSRYPVTTTCLPSEKIKHVTILQHEPTFPLQRREGNGRLTHINDRSQNHIIVRQQQRTSFDHKSGEKHLSKPKQKDICDRLDDFSKENQVLNEVDSEEYLRTWFQNLAMRAKLKLL